MQAFAASSNALVTSSPARVINRWRRPTVSHSSLMKLEMPHRLHETASNRWNMPATYMTTPDLKTMLYNCNDELRLQQFFEEVGYQVQDCELDQHGTVRNDVYSSYCQYGHDELLRRIGLSTEAIAQTGEAITFSESSLRLFAPLKGGEKFVVKTSVSCISAREIFVEDAIFKLPNYELVLEANATAVWLDTNSRPIHIQPGLRAKLLRLDFLDELE